MGTVLMGKVFMSTVFMSKVLMRKLREHTASPSRIEVADEVSAVALRCSLLCVAGPGTVRLPWCNSSSLLL